MGDSADSRSSINSRSESSSDNHSKSTTPLKSVIRNCRRDIIQASVTDILIQQGESR